MSKYNVAAALAAFGTGRYSHEDNDLNVNVQAQHDGDGESEAEAPVADAFDEGVDAEAPAEVVDAPAEIAQDTSGTPETAELDTADAVEATEDTAEKIENLDEMTDGLEGIALQLAQITTEGIEVTPFLRNTLRTNYEFVTRKYPGLRKPSVGISSMEAFDTNPGQALEFSFESVMDSIKGGIAKIVEFLKNLWERIKAFFGNGAAAGNVIKLKAKKIASIEVPKKQVDRVDIPSILRGNTIDASEVKQLTSVINNITNARYGELIKSLSNGEDAQTAMHNANKALFSGNMSNLFGGFSLSITPDGMKIGEGKKGTVERAAPPSSGEITAMANANADLADALINYSKASSTRKTINDQMVKILTEKGKEEDASWLKRRDATKKAAGVWGKQQSFEQQVIKKAVAAANALNNYLVASTKPAKANPNK